MKYYYIPDYDTRVICYDLENNLMDKLYYAVKTNNDFFIFGNVRDDIRNLVEAYIEGLTSFSMVSFIDFENTTPSNTQLENSYQIMDTLDFIKIL